MPKRRDIRQMGEVTLFECMTCHAYFDRANFYADKRTPTGLKSECKRCHCLTTVATRNVDRHRADNNEQMRLYRKRPEVMERDRIRSRVRNASLEAKARALANRAVELGFLIRPKICPKCGSSDKPVHAHHPDHIQPLNVEWLCSQCHGIEHRTIATDQNGQRVTP